MCCGKDLATPEQIVRKAEFRAKADSAFDLTAIYTRERFWTRVPIKEGDKIYVLGVGDAEIHEGLKLELDPRGGYKRGTCAYRAM